MKQSPISSYSAISQQIDWDSILAEISQFAYFEITKQNISSPHFYKNKEQIQSQFNTLDYFINNINNISAVREKFFIKLPCGNDYHPQVDALINGQVLNVEKIHQLTLFLEVFKELYLLNSDKGAQYSKIEDGQFKQLLILIKNIRRIIQEDGELNYKADPELASLYQSFNKIGQNIRNIIKQVAASEEYAPTLQFGEFDIVNERFVLAIRSDSYRATLGNIIARSSSGMTLFVEPFSITEITNKRMVLKARIDERIEKICQEITHQVFSLKIAIAQTIQYIYFCDQLISFALYSIKHRLTRPQLSDSDSTISIKNLFNPLVQNVQANDLYLSSDKKGFVISGPNAGGKTVFLKSLMLCFFFIHKGLFIPATQASLFLFKDFYFFGHDNQSINQGLSSFAAEVQAYCQMASKIKVAPLIIIDEVFSSTSSEEASSLAIGLMNYIAKVSDSKVFISTHHQLLKTLMHQNHQYISAHMLYDQHHHRPLFKIAIGSPGSSMAFEVFESIISQGDLSEIGLPHILDDARNIIGRKNYSYEKILHEISVKNANLDKILRDNEQLNIELKNLKKSQQGLIQLEKEKILSTYKEKIFKLIEQAKDLKLNAQRYSKKELFENAQKIKKEISHDQNLPSLPKKSLKSFHDFKIGDKVVYLANGNSFKITHLNSRKNSICLQSGPIKIWVSPNEIDHNQSKSSPSKVSINFHSPEAATEIDCRAMRLEEFIREVDIHLEALVNGQIPFLTVIHGHGDGILKNYLRKKLARSKEFRWRPSEGNDGSTEISIES